MRSDLERLLDIKEAIERIEKYSKRGKESFYADELIQNWITHCLQIIGGAAAKLSEEIRVKNSDIPWEKIIGMRNILVHDYFEIDNDIVWNAVINDIPCLKEKVSILIQNISKGGL